MKIVPVAGDDLSMLLDASREVRDVIETMLIIVNDARVNAGQRFEAAKREEPSSKREINIAIEQRSEQVLRKVYSDMIDSLTSVGIRVDR